VGDARAGRGRSRTVCFACSNAPSSAAARTCGCCCPISLAAVAAGIFRGSRKRLPFSASRARVPSLCHLALSLTVCLGAARKERIWATCCSPGDGSCRRALGRQNWFGVGASGFVLAACGRRQQTRLAALAAGGRNGSCTAGRRCRSGAALLYTLPGGRTGGAALLPLNFLLSCQPSMVLCLRRKDSVPPSYMLGLPAHLLPLPAPCLPHQTPKETSSQTPPPFYLARTQSISG